MVGAELFLFLRIVALISTFKALHPIYFHELVSNLYNCCCAVCWVARVKVPMKGNRISCDYSDFSAKRNGEISSRFVLMHCSWPLQFKPLKWLALTVFNFWFSSSFVSYLLFCNRCQQRLQAFTSRMSAPPTASQKLPKPSTYTLLGRPQLECQTSEVYCQVFQGKN